MPSSPIFTSEKFIREPITYYLKRQSNRTVEPGDWTEIKAIGVPEFWFMFRNITWKGTDPREEVRAQGGVIEKETSMRFGEQEVTALLVRKQGTLP